MTTKNFKIGDIVRISANSEFYIDNNISNPKNMNGVIKTIDTTDFPAFPIEVDWDNEISSRYNESDLELIDTQEIKKYKILKDFSRYSKNSIQEFNDSYPVLWVGKDDFKIVTSIKELITQGFIVPLQKVFKKGDWIFAQKDNFTAVFEYNGTIDACNNYECIQGVKYKNNIFYQFRENTAFFRTNSGERLATSEEIKKSLITIAKEKGFKQGVKIKSPVYKKIQTINREGFKFNEYTNSLSVSSDMYDTSSANGDFIYYNGEWAEIIKEEALQISGYIVKFHEFEGKNVVSIGCRHNILKEYFDAILKASEFCRMYDIKLSFYDDGNIEYKGNNINTTIKQIQERLTK